METLSYFVVFAAGIAVDATYNYFRNKGEKSAYENGYKRAKSEEDIRKNAFEKGKYQERYNHQDFNSTPYPMGVPKVPTKKQFVDEEFMANLKTNGKAIARIK